MLNLLVPFISVCSWISNGEPIDLQIFVSCLPYVLSLPLHDPLYFHFHASFSAFPYQYSMLVLTLLIFPCLSADEKGVHRDFIAQQLRVSVDKLMSLSLSLSLFHTLAFKQKYLNTKFPGFDRLAIQNLVEEGLIYSTTDDFHFKSTING